MTTLIQKVNAGFVRVGELLKGKVNSTRQIATGTGLTGGGDLTADRTLTLADSGVVAGTYGSSTSVPVVTFDSKGRATTVTTATVTGGGGSQPPWVDLAVLTANNFASGFPDGTNKLQIGKDSSGFIWVKGVFRNTSASANSNLAITFPTAYMVRQVNTGTTVATPLLLINSNSSAAGRPTSTFYITGSQFFGLTTGSYDANGTYIIPPTIIGMALNP